MCERSEAAFRVSHGGHQAGATPEGSFHTAGNPPLGAPVFVLRTRLTEEMEEMLPGTHGTRAGTRTYILSR